MKNNNKELIDLIREGLKNAEELPYKEGAWEAYKAKYEPAQKVRRLAPLWVAAAVAALAGFTFLFNDWNEPTESIHVVKTEQKSVNPGPMADETTDKPLVIDETGRLASTDVQHKTDVQHNEESNERFQPHLAMQEITQLDRMAIQPLDMARLGNTSVLTSEIKKPDLMVFREDRKPVAVLAWDDDLIAGQQVDPNFAYQSEAARQLSPKKLRLTDRFELGAFLSPSTTDRSFDLGGGLVFAYRFNDKLAIRTGASFNQYEVGMLKSHVQEIGEEKKQEAAPIKNTDKVISKEASSLRANNFFIPNLNAVTGKVQTLDIPLEIRYNLTKQFYATGGVSYAAVLSQERFDHYEESAGIPTYSSVSDSEKPAQNSVTTVETTKISEDENINTNGFGGFVNFSVGRKVNVGKTMKVSVEPFVKLPVGQFKRADMNYTNGGIRIITSF
ncbi:outer membrane beta-barrel protein [Sphingobacterium chuzhouense]|uniref:Outer membrane beta-barrel protein n=1 Tax=Sphingobacterium chuzhouense TaxID=1742264 RepID=A0ABR7XQ12_9SPHI|nr:outer membrane beta-barrel protein [Sphingobacterium chuzhouense]MBD1421261.1 outer membrane beta-barrel protein [Sphingobacterium chuzhouense]